LGIDVNLTDAIRPDALLFGETQSRIVLSLPGGNLRRIEAIADRYGVTVTAIGRTGGSRFICKGPAFHVDLPVTLLDQAWRGAVPAYFGRR
jgi:phosphoribosylformylglycinamidine synthase